MFTDRIFPQNRYITRCRAENETQSLKGKHVLVIGGTQGIGAGLLPFSPPLPALFLGMLTCSCCKTIRRSGM